MISIVIPCHNEKDAIGTLILQIEQAISGLNFDIELIVVDDGSTDETFEVLQDLKKKRSWMRIIRHKRNYGQSMALYTGVFCAKGEVVVTLDGDGQNPPSEIPKLVNKLIEFSKVRMVVGWRKQRKDIFIKQFSSCVANFIRNLFLRDGVHDSGCGLKAFYRADFLLLPRIDHLHRFLPFLFKNVLGLDVIEVPVAHNPRTVGKGHYGVWRRAFFGIVDIFGMLWFKSRFRSEVEVEYVSA